jgi:adenine deaminase
VSGRIVNVRTGRIFTGTVVVEAGRITAIHEQPISESPAAPLPYILPGFVDSHIHIESSMMPPASFAQVAVRFGTVATVSDPHEIANVLGRPGVEYMLASANETPLKFHFGCPS